MKGSKILWIALITTALIWVGILWGAEIVEATKEITLEIVKIYCVIHILVGTYTLGALDILDKPTKRLRNLFIVTNPIILVCVILYYIFKGIYLGIKLLNEWADEKLTL